MPNYGVADDGVDPGDTAMTSGVALKQVFFWTHHTRRKQLLIYEWAAELRISGSC